MGAVWRRDGADVCVCACVRECVSACICMCVCVKEARLARWLAVATQRGPAEENRLCLRVCVCVCASLRQRDGGTKKELQTDIRGGATEIDTEIEIETKRQTDPCQVLAALARLFPDPLTHNVHKVHTNTNMQKVFKIKTPQASPSRQQLMTA